MAYTATMTRSMLKEFFGDRLILRGLYLPQTPSFTPPIYLVEIYERLCFSDRPYLDRVYYTVCVTEAVASIG